MKIFVVSLNMKFIFEWPTLFAFCHISQISESTVKSFNMLCVRSEIYGCYLRLQYRTYCHTSSHLSHNIFFRRDLARSMPQANKHDSDYSGMHVKYVFVFCSNVRNFVICILHQHHAVSGSYLVFLFHFLFCWIVIKLTNLAMPCEPIHLLQIRYDFAVICNTSRK